MSPTLVVKTYSEGSNSVTIRYRSGTSDERVLKEVIEQRCYRKVRSGFDVMPHERWLDLGANIGAFAGYCELRGAYVECYEPEPDCFRLLRNNFPTVKAFPMAVTNSHQKQITLFRSPSETEHYKNTICPSPRFTQSVTVVNKHGEVLKKQKFDGVKMDIEGAEHGLLDEWLLPRCEKLIMEYHTSKDASVKNFVHRMNQLRAHFEHVKYPPEFDRAIAAKLSTFKTYFDRVIYAWGAK